MAAPGIGTIIALIVGGEAVNHAVRASMSRRAARVYRRYSKQAEAESEANLRRVTAAATGRRPVAGVERGREGAYATAASEGLADLASASGSPSSPSFSEMLAQELQGVNPMLGDEAQRQAGIDGFRRRSREANWSLMDANTERMLSDKRVGNLRSLADMESESKGQATGGELAAILAAEAAKMYGYSQLFGKAKAAGSAKAGGKAATAAKAGTPHSAAGYWLR